MILTCPKCATRFFAADDTIGLSGRRVECNVCHEVWLSGRTESIPSKGLDVVDVADGISPKEAAQDSIGVSESTEPVGAPLFVERPPAVRKTRGAPSIRPWALALLVVAFAIVAGMFVFQRQIEGVFPGAPALYHSLGIRNADRAGG